MEKILVDLGAKSYEIFIGKDILGSVEKFVSGKALLVTQENIFKLCGEKFPYEVALIPDGETSKSLGEAEKLFTRAIEAGLDRKSVVIALGGGVVGDLAGFVAATFMRGINLIQIPTTLLAQVDSSVGGKTAVNHALGKNLIGAFHQPRAVFIDLNFLKTLPEREIKSGLGEVVKYGVISDENFFAYLEDNAEKILQRDLKTLAHVVKRSCEIKAEVVAADEKESGLRRILNFGHTLAHAIEEQTGYKKYRHGEAVAIGMVAAAQISHELGKTSAENVQRLEKLLKRFDMVTTCAGLDADKLYAVTFRDKKTVGGKVNWVLMKNFGDVEICGDVPASVVKKVFTRLTEH
ncbi:MAG: 3-dehydroquinate synthase [Selenomonadaceae bacterium]|nr:3-dehydroquinate synthase [Selenomonadaceae bacterium]MBQ7493401.1 3-dehydroquinate synthase [Selenomonadaceae bacterium]